MNQEESLESSLGKFGGCSRMVRPGLCSFERDGVIGNEGRRNH